MHGSFLYAGRASSGIGIVFSRLEHCCILLLYVGCRSLHDICVVSFAALHLSFDSRFVACVIDGTMNCSSRFLEGYHLEHLWERDRVGRSVQLTGQ